MLCNFADPCLFQKGAENPYVLHGILQITAIDREEALAVIDQVGSGILGRIGFQLITDGGIRSLEFTTFKSFVVSCIRFLQMWE